MKSVFVDTVYWVGRASQWDQWHERARQLSELLGETRLVTTDEVLVEFLNFFSRYGVEMRRRAVAVARQILRDANIQVVPQTRASFESGVALYERRSDKEYSLTDCISMETMRNHGLTQVVTNDHHFTQEGFALLSNGQDR